MNAPEQKPLAERRMQGIIADRFVRGFMVAAIGFLVAFLTIVVLRVPSSSPFGNSEWNWCMAGVTIGFVLGGLLPSDRIGPKTTTVILAVVLGSFAGVVMLGIWGVAAAEHAVSQVHWKKMDRPVSQSKIHPGVSFTRVAMRWGYFSGAAVGLLSAAGWLTRKKRRLIAVGFSLSVMIATSGAIFFVRQEFAEIERGYVKWMQDWNDR